MRGARGGSKRRGNGRDVKKVAEFMLCKCTILESLNVFMHLLLNRSDAIQ